MHVWPLRYLPVSGLCKARELLDRYILFATQDSGMITDVNMDRFLVFLIVHDDSSADHEACAHCNEDVAPAVQGVVEDLIVICDKNKKSLKDIESNQWTLIDPLLALKNFNPTVHFSIIEDRPFIDQMEAYSKWHGEENLREVLLWLGKSDMLKISAIIRSSLDKDVEISERLHSLADGLPQAGVPVDVFWFICGRDALPVRSHMHLFGALKRLQLWHNANITVLHSNKFDMSSFLTSWQKGLKLSVTPFNKIDALSKIFSGSVVWQGSLVFNENQSRTIIPGFSLRCDRSETEISFGSSRIQPKRKKKNPMNIGKRLCIAPDITILCRVQKHTVPFHMFLPVRLGLSVNQSSTKLSVRLVEWLSFEENKNIALVGSLQLVTSYKHCTQRKNREAWFNYVKSQNPTASVTNRLDGNTGDEDLTESCRRLCLVCGSAEKELSLYVLRRPEDLNGWIHKELSSIQSSFLISNDQKVGGPLKFPELSESFIETEQNLTEVLLQELQKELQNSDDLFSTHSGCNIVDKTTSTKRQFLKEKRLGWKEHELEPVDRNVLPLDVSELSLSPSKWPERAWLVKNDPNARGNDSVADESTKNYPLLASVSSLSISDILEKFRRDGTPARSDLVRLEPREQSSSGRHVQIERGSIEEVRGKCYPEALEASYHGIEYCLDVREAISKDLQLSRLQSSLVKNETLSSCVLTEHKTRETRCTRAVTNAAKKGSKASLAKLAVPLSRTATIRNGKKPAALIGSSSRSLKKKSPVIVKAPTVAKKRKREDANVEEGKASDENDVKKKETRSERHKRRLRQVVQNTLEGNGIDSSHPFYESCTGRLYSLCKSFLKDLRSSHGLNDEMKRLAKSNVQQVIEFETKRKSAAQTT
ncbi:mdm2-binding protein [Pocillopora verrucosa]|uniref:mdm2-binding protein n=1 Tax=Pocillopora verrucosa TaxID=203993 RepID=UPI003342565F